MAALRKQLQVREGERECGGDGEKGSGVHECQGLGFRV